MQIHPNIKNKKLAQLKINEMELLREIQNKI